MNRYLVIFGASLLACRPEPAATEPVTAAPTGNEHLTRGTPDPAFARAAMAVRNAHLDAHPISAVALGLHDFDGRLPDVSGEALEHNRKRVKQDLATLAAYDPETMSATQRLEHASLNTTLENDRFDLEVTRMAYRNPMYYMGALELTPYIARDYAPLEQRAKAVIAVAQATPIYLQQAAANLEPALPRTFVATALLQLKGTLEFVSKDVPMAFADAGPTTKHALERALTTMRQSLEVFTRDLQDRSTHATDDYALGTETFSAMLAQTQGINVDLAHLASVLEADLQRNLAAMTSAAKEIDPASDVAAVVRTVVANKPEIDDVLETAREQARQTRAFILDRGLVTIPSEDIAVVTETPPFMRWNSAFLDGAGPFETKPLPSFYYISPPNPTWSPVQQHEYLPSEVDLLFVTVHEVWPGHFLHSLHVKQNPSEILQSSWNYTTGEGWAHYAEEMMWNQGLSTDPRVHVGQLLNALLRNVRAKCALGLHTQGMTVADAKQAFVTQAFQDDATAEQQAVRGTFDPMYLAYTVGKLAIQKLRTDYQAQVTARGETFDLGTFHNALLGHAAAPLSATRAVLLGPDAGPLL